MSRRRSLSDDEHALWRRFAQSITPLRAPVRGAKTEKTSAETKPESKSANKPAKNSPPPAPPRSAKGADAPPRPRPAPDALFVTPPALTPLDRRSRQRIARGRQPIDARIDLHGMTQREAHGALLRFLHRAQADGARTVIVVTGKGSGATAKGGADEVPRERGVLRRQVPMWLALPEFRPLVVGFVDAHAGHGGEGALYVRLRRGR